MKILDRKKAEKFRRAVAAGAPTTFGHLFDCGRIKAFQSRVSPCTCGKAQADAK